MHMELQWTMWMPWSFWALHRTLATGLARRAADRAFVAADASSIYYGVFLGTLLGVARCCC